MLDRAQVEGYNTVRTLAIASGHIEDAATPDRTPQAFKRNGGGRIR